MKVPRRRIRPVTSPPAMLPPPAEPQPAAASTPTNSALELPVAQPSPAEPIVYETLRSDATAGDVSPENPYLIPAEKPEHAARPVDLSNLLADQQLNAAAASGGMPDQSASVANEQQYDDAAFGRELILFDTSPPSASPPQSSAQDVLYTNLAGVDLPASEASPQLPFTADSAPVSSLAETNMATEASSADTPSRPSLPLSASLSSPLASGPANTHQSMYALRLPSYEESLSSDT